MKKSFNVWHDEKNYLHADKLRAYFHEREVWFASVGLNIGFEQDGRGDKSLRPVVVIKKFNAMVLWCAPLTTASKSGKYYYTFMLNDAYSTAILSQIRLIDAKRLQYKLGTVSTECFVQIKERLKQLLA